MSAVSAGIDANGEWSVSRVSTVPHRCAIALLVGGRDRLVFGAAHVGAGQLASMALR